MSKWRYLGAGLLLISMVLLMNGKTYWAALPWVAAIPICIFINKLEGDRTL